MTEANSIIAQIPTSFYAIVGGLILLNLGTIVTVFYGVGKLVWFMSKMDSRVENLEEKTDKDGPIAKDINAAHAAIREVKQEIRANP